MKACEIGLIVILVLLGIYTAMTDIRYGVIQNKVLAAGICAGGILDFIYYRIFAAEFLITFFTNVVVVTVLAVALYAFHFWAAGDSKLLMCVALLFPARFYDAGGSLRVPALIMVVMIFLLAYLYVVLDSIYQAVHNSRFFGGGKISKEEVWKFFTQYIICFLYLNAMSRICERVLGQIYYENMLAFTFVNIFLAFFIQSKPVFKRWYMLLLLFGINVVLYQKPQGIRNYLSIYLVLLLALFLRYLIGGYNYAEIPTDQAKPGMILAIGTILEFQKSRVKGLPITINEDMSTRISVEEAEAVRRWKDSKYGKDTIVIVRKIPFAVFITGGTMLFLLIRMYAG